MLMAPAGDGDAGGGSGGTEGGNTQTTNTTSHEGGVDSSSSDGEGSSRAPKTGGQEADTANKYADLDPALAGELSAIDSDGDIFEYQKEALKEEAKKNYADRVKKEAAKKARKEKEALEAEELEAESDPEKKALLEKSKAEKAAKELAEKEAKEVIPDDKKVKFTANGKEVEVPMKELKKAYGLAEKANSVLNENGNLKKAIDQVTQAINQGPDGVLALINFVLKDETGNKAYQIAEKLVAQRIKVELMDDNEKAQWMKDQELARYRDSERKAKEAEIQAQNQRNQEALNQHYAKVYAGLQAEVKTQGLPNSAITNELIVKGLSILVDKGYSPQEIGDGKAIIPWVKKQFEQHRASLYTNPEEVIGFDPEAEEKWRNYLNKKYSAGKNQLPPNFTPEDTGKKPPKKANKKTIDDFKGDRMAYVNYLRQLAEEG